MEHPEGKPFSPYVYRHFGCRCDGCRAANSKYQTEYRKKYGRRLSDYSFEQRRAKEKLKGL